MCQYMIRIAEDAKERAFFRCEHGTFHLTWGSAVFSLTLRELSSLKAMLVDVQQGEKPRATKRGLRLFQRISAEGIVFFELWMNEVGLRLLAEDCPAFEKLVEQALAWVELQPPFTPDQHVQMAQLLENMASPPSSLEKFYCN